MSLAGGERKAKKKSWKVDGEKQFAELQQKALSNRKTAFSPQKHYRVFYHSGENFPQVHHIIRWKFHTAKVVSAKSPGMTKHFYRDIFNVQLLLVLFSGYAKKMSLQSCVAKGETRKIKSH